MNYDQELTKAATDMHEAEDALVQNGFPVEQWMLIKQYIGAAIIQNTAIIANALSQTSSGVIVAED
jgi:hypothetical protein